MSLADYSASAVSNPRLFLTRIFNLVVQGYDEFTLVPANGAASSSIKIAVSEDNAQITGAGLKKPALLDDDLTLSDEAAKLLKGKAVEVTLSSESSIDLTFTLPSSPLKDLRGMIEAEILYRSPFGDGQSYSIWEAQETESGNWDIKAAVTLKPTLEPVLEALKYAGASITSVRRVEDGPKPGFVARPEWAVGAPKRSFAPLLSLVPDNLMLPAAAAALLIVSIFLIHIQTGLNLSRLENRASGSRTALAEVARAAQAEREIYNLEKASLQRLIVTGMLTEKLPDEYWLQQIIIDNQTLTVAGFGPSAADVTRILTDFSGLVEVGFASPVTRDNTQNIERFRIGAEFNTEGFTVSR